METRVILYWHQAFPTVNPFLNVLVKITRLEWCPKIVPLQFVECTKFTEITTQVTHFVYSLHTGRNTNIWLNKVHN